jgi:hypothetical protein
MCFRFGIIKTRLTLHPASLSGPVRNIPNQASVTNCLDGFF